MDVRRIGPPGLPAKRIVPSRPHAPPSATAIPEASVFTDPPSMSMRLRLRSEKNTMDRPSGDQNGCLASLVPANGLTKDESSVLNHN
jgi:hypothetical protein